MRPSSRDEFAIAIICALTFEAEAVEELFDETYDRLSEFYKKQPGDDNAYFNGRIGNHHVVLCCMPRMGKGHAASVAASLKISYRGIQVALVVGVCGGAPCSPAREEIFLGDVIISDAVIEYDFGRQYRGGFERKTGVKDTLGRPNREIQSLLAGLQLQRSRRELQAKTLRHLQAIQESQPRWRCPSSVDDALFEASYQHKHNSLTSPHMCLCLENTSDEVCKAALDTICTQLGCDEGRICRRRTCTGSYSPRIHIGAVASADTVMKSGEHRDNLVKSEGVIGFEMEAAGVWNNISCIIIKGVCDYADSHKNKAWQAYAAAAGASTAKAFLEYWKPAVREEANKYHIPLDLTAVPAIEEFVGRENELRQLWNYLQPGTSQRRRVAVLHGLGGIGKTQLAIHFARTHRTLAFPRFPGQSMNIAATNEEEAEQRARKALEWLALPDNMRWLIIFDNIDQYSFQEHDDCGYDIYEFFPKADHGSIIITSRLQGLTELGKSFPVQKLMYKDATQLLLQSSGFSAEDIARMGAEQDITDLTNKLDGLSLAIVIAGAFMSQTGTNIKEYLELYQTSWFELQSQSGTTRHYQQGNIVQTWMITYQELQRRDSAAAKLLLLLAFFDNQDIWYELIRCALYCCSPPPWFEMSVSSKLVFKAKIKALIEFSLVETRQQEGSYTLHPVVQDWCYQLHELSLISVGYMVPSKENRDFTRLQQRLLPHANHLLQKERHSCQNDRINVYGALAGLGTLYYTQGKLKEAEEMYQQALAGYEKLLSPDHISTLNTGKLKEAEQMYQRALAGKEKALGPDHTSTLVTVNAPRTCLPEGPRKRDILYRIFRLK
ncbi:hypothetical protein BDW68DRAFT_189921 [Aspergillus falconensis]